MSKLNLIFVFFLFLILQGCQQESKDYIADKSVDITLSLPTKEKLKTKVVFNNADHTRGLSGTPSSQFEYDQAMLFYYFFEDYKRFWMPDTYFDLDIFFLNKEFKIIDLQRNVTHHPGRTEPPKIVRTKTVKCWHVLELRADSTLAKKLKVGDKLSWDSAPYPEQIKPKTRL